MKRGLIFCLLSLLIVSVWTSLPRVQAVPPPQRVELLDGAKWTYSTDGGKTFSPESPIIKAETTVPVLARTEFDVAEPSEFVVLELTHGLPVRLRRKPKFTLNGNAVKGPMDGMYYRTIGAIDAKLLKKGKNVLTEGITIKNVSSKKRKAKDIEFKVDMRLVAPESPHLRIQTGPIIGAIGKDYFTVTCRTNMPAEVETRCIVGGKSLTFREQAPAPHSKGLLHRIRINTADLTPDCRCSLWAIRSDYNIGNRLTLPKPLPGSDLRFVAMGDSRTHPEKWTGVASAVVKAKPDLVVFSGDMVNRGKNDWEWDEQFFTPAKELFTTIPFYAVIGNHEENAPVYNELFYTPSKDGKSRNFSQEINGVLLIGINGKDDFSSKSDNGKWLEKTLADSKANFIFFFSHYPAWSSSVTAGLTRRLIGQGKRRSARHRMSSFRC